MIHPRERERERESERESGGGGTTPCRVTPALGARAPAWTARTIPPLSVWPCGTLCRQHTREPRPSSGPPQSPIRSLEVSGSQTHLLTPWYKGWGRDHPFPISVGSPWRDRDGTRRVGHICNRYCSNKHRHGHGLRTLHPRGENYMDRVIE